MKCLSLILLQAVLAAAAPYTHVQHERRDVDDTPHLVKRNRVHGGTVMPVRIGLHGLSMDKGHDLLMEVSDPFSKSYGKWYTPEQIIDLFAPSEESVAAVRAWLESHRGFDPEIISLSANKQWLQFDTDASTLEDLLQTQYHHYENTHTGTISVGCDHYHVPAEVSAHIDYITPGVKHVKTKKRSVKNQKRSTARQFQGPKSRRIPPGGLERISSGNTDCGYAITPECIRQLYHINDTITAQPGNSVAAYETVLDCLDQGSLTNFLKTFEPKIPSDSFPFVNRVDGAPVLGSCVSQFGSGGESQLDFSILYPLTYPTDIQLFQVDDTHYEETDGATLNMTDGLFNTFLDAIDGSYCNYSAFGVKGDTPGTDPIYPDTQGGYGHHYKGQLQCGVYKPTSVISISYSLDEDQYPTNYQRRQCKEWMKLGMMGTSVVFATGDVGVSPKVTPCLGPQQKGFGVGQAISCPYTLAVGATYLPPGSHAGVTPEVASTAIYSGGGFSNIFLAPSWQESALEYYFQNHDPGYPYYNQSGHANATKPGRYNRAGRGIPDVSANGQNIAVFEGSFPTMDDGTSASAPIWSGILTRINAARIAAGKSTVGFVSPTLYANPSAFFDIKRGDNPGCGTNGFSAVSGWDPVTGLGTPNYPLLKDAFLALP